MLRNRRNIIIGMLPLLLSGCVSRFTLMNAPIHLRFHSARLSADFKCDISGDCVSKEEFEVFQKAFDDHIYSKKVERIEGNLPQLTELELEALADSYLRAASDSLDF